MNGRERPRDDAEAAAKAGLRNIGVLYGGFSEDGLREARYIAINERPTDLLAQYDRSPFAPAKQKVLQSLRIVLCHEALSFPAGRPFRWRTNTNGQIT